ncbi:hypothetical protein GWK47_051922 [Chionoecetes opilio]|uniref:Uncharacterized protein n=1 Tax=Chionoecetes opilio TaxID=41210 RepID=A0A8J4Y0C6_CHIOP|nr:hypothetical protein GWK47_051922 [Chionoecetes opilio]
MQSWALAVLFAVLQYCGTTALPNRYRITQYRKGSLKVAQYRYRIQISRGTFRVPTCYSCRSSPDRAEATTSTCLAYPSSRRQRLALDSACSVCKFPIRVAFAMTINKCQGQTKSYVGVYLPTPVFTHGQLYVSLSRVGCADAIEVLAPRGFTRNVVYPEAL